MTPGRLKLWLKRLAAVIATPGSPRRALFARAAEPKQMWEVPGAAHVDMKRAQGTEYDSRVLQFLSRYLGAPPIGDPPR